ncbi:ankyrin repeat and zinc finger domain-containing protein 1 [Sesamum indicum]|uniref:Ankyrin repeat and zinc finger domain-containing protein 1 n=1 Tax=Sesamum indicum TaxID=4182 RepID=A0A6I9TXR9_SESIN|nr:ankyrin repeat and zinc finger domain-containing protein 1 [Sesamum indicum]
MATPPATATTIPPRDRPTKPQPKKQYKQDDSNRHCSIFQVSSDFFDSCRLLDSPLSSLPLPDADLSQENALRQPNLEKEIIDNSNNDTDGNGSKAMQRWSCNTCKAEFESLQDQRFHFKSDLHRFNIKLSIAGKNIIKEEDFDEATSDSLCKDYDVSSISGSEDEDERETSLPPDRQQESGGVSKSKMFVQLQNGERVSIWKGLLLDESEHVSFETDKSLVVDGAGDTYLTQREVIEKLKYVLHEPRDNTCLRIVLLARGGHFAGCVFDGNSLVAHKTFHRYVVRARAGKKQSSKDAGGRAIHSAGASLRRYNEYALKKDIQELLTLWKPYFAVASCIFIYAPSNNRLLFFDGDKPYFICQDHAIRNIPLTVRRPTFKEASRIYSLLVQISYEVSGEIAPNTKQEPLSHANARSESGPESCEMELRESVEGAKTSEACSIVTEIADLSLSVESKEQIDTVGTSTPLHEAAKSGNAQKVLELLEQGLDPCIKDERGQTPYMLASEKEVRNTFRRFMASNLEKWDWHAAKVPSALTKEMEESQAAKQAEKDAKKKARAKELKKLRKAKEKKAQAEAVQSQNGSFMSGNSGSGTAPTTKVHSQSSSSIRMSKEEELKRIQDSEREKRAAAAERRIAALKAQETGSLTAPSNTQLNNTSGSDMLCSCCNASLAGKVPFHRYHYKYCSTSCMHVHREILEDG